MALLRRAKRFRDLNHSRPTVRPMSRFPVGREGSRTFPPEAMRRMMGRPAFPGSFLVGHLPGLYDAPVGAILFNSGDGAEE